MSLIVDQRGAALFRGRLIPCAIGRGGMSSDKREGDGASPRGEWAVEFGYFRADRVKCPRSHIPFTAISARDGWCDDPRSLAYNEAVLLPFAASHERMRRGDGLYDVVLVLNHNRGASRTSGKGSAIFVHHWRRVRYPTEGCLAFAPKDLRWIVGQWRSEDRFIIR